LATPTITLSSPTPGQPLYNLKPTISISYTSDDPAAPIDPSTLQVTVNGVDWTSRFAKGPDSASYAVSAADALVAGTLAIGASVKDSAAAVASFAQTIAVHPTLLSISPTIGPVGAEVTVAGQGLDPQASHNGLLFRSVFSLAGVVAPFTSVDLTTGTGKARVPSEAYTGPVALVVNQNPSKTTLRFTVRTEYPDCGSIDKKLVSLPDGTVLAQYFSYGAGPGCPPLPLGSANGFNAIAALRPIGDIHPSQVVIATPVRETFTGFFVRGFATDKAGAQLYTLSEEVEDRTRLVYRLYRGGHLQDPVTEIVPPGGVLLTGAMDFDSDGNLYIVGVPSFQIGNRTAHILKVASQELGADLASAQLVTSVETSDIGASVAWVLHPGLFAISCGGVGYLGVNDGHVYKLDLSAGAVIGTIAVDVGPTAFGFLTGLALDCHADELLTAAEVDVSNENIRFARFQPGGPSGPIDFIPQNFLATPLTVAPDGSILAVHWSRGIIAIRPRVEPCSAAQTSSPGSCPDPAACSGMFQPYCLRPAADTIEILASTERWKPQRDGSDNITVDFKGPSDLDAATVRLEVTTTGGPATYTPTIGTVTKVAGTEDQYTFEWTGPWTYTDASGTQPMPRGNYTLVVAGKLQGSSDEIRTAPYDKVSLVEVKQIRFRSLPGAPLDGNPGPGGGVPASGARIFAEARDPIETDPAQPIFSQVEIVATIDPPIPDPGDRGPVKVYFRPLDVDDPAPDGLLDDETRLLDNRGPQASLTDENGVEILSAHIVALPASGAEAHTVLHVSRRQGDNYRVASSTSSEWPARLSAVTGSLTGEVLHATDPTVPEGVQVTEMLTVWRTLHVERERFAPGTLTQRDLQVNGTWTGVGKKKLEDDGARPFFSWRTADGVPDHTRKGEWEGAALNPFAPAGQDFKVKGNNDRRVKISSGDLRPIANPADPSYYLRDDLLDSLTGLKHDTSMLARIMAQVYVRVEEVDRAPVPFLPFVHNLSDPDQNLMRGSFTNSAVYWNVPLLLAFESERTSDNDPTGQAGPVNGRCSRGPQPVAAVFAENIRDFKAGVKCPNFNPTIALADIYASNAAHEVLHALTLDHDGDASGGIMCSAIKNYADQPGRFDVTGAQLARLRDLQVPNRPSDLVELEPCVSRSCR
jgi:hypothetical protein